MKGYMEDDVKVNRVPIPYPLALILLVCLLPLDFKWERKYKKLAKNKTNFIEQLKTHCKSIYTVILSWHEFQEYTGG